jgi:predicted GNAT family acetyltransferase
LTYQSKPFHANYVAAFERERCTAVAAHCWNGMLLLQAPEHSEDLARACIHQSGRSVAGLSGPLEHVRRARTALGLARAPTLTESDEALYGVNLENVVRASPNIQCRLPRSAERDLLCSWRFAFAIETSVGTDSEETRQEEYAHLDRQIADGEVWVAVADGKPVSMSAFNATLPDIVQIGGVYTPPELRGRGYAKDVVAASLIAAREQGVTRAVLFTDNPSAARSYEGIGFRHIGEYGLIVFAD